MHVPLLDLKAQFEQIRDEIYPAMRKVVESQHFIGGPNVEELEQRIAARCDCAAAVGVSSGTDALLCSLMALEVGRGDEVITTPYTFFSTAGSIWRTGATPVFADIRPDTYNIDPNRVEEAVSERTRAVIPVHLFGQCADMDPILEAAERHGLHVIEDAAQAIGATYRGRPAGSRGTMGCFSFYPTKNLGGFGDGGMITTGDEELADRLRSLRNHGQTGRYVHQRVGGNFRLDALQAAVLGAKLPYLEGWSEARRRNAALYDDLLADLAPVVTPTVREQNVCIFNQYVIRAPERDALREHLAEREIGTAIYYPLSLHRQDCFEPLGYEEGDFPESESAARETLALPVYPELAEEQIRHVAQTIRDYFA